MTHQLPKLPYALDALEPHIDATTIGIHYGKHHQTYADNLNKLVPGTEFAVASLEEIVLKAQGPIFNNAAQVWNHTFYWEGMKPNGGGEPQGELRAAIEKSFSNFAGFKEQLSKISVTQFGSGWGWLVKKKDGVLAVVQTGNAANPLTTGDVPLLTCDVWEHAYYLKYQNRRADYVGSWWNVINWDAVAARFNAANKK
ncbi:MAG: superoxide dismutase [Verrucomicrobiota bacterium]